MKIRKLISAYKTRFLGQKVSVEQATIAGRKFFVAGMTINKKADKDDAWWYALASKHSFIFDIGANVGFSTILACMEDEDKKIVLADPNPQALDLAKQNLLSNGMATNKTYINAFVGERKGEEVKFYTLGAGSAGSMFGSHADSARAVNAHYMVPTTTLDDIVEETGVTPTLVKIDVEAAESYVLKGAKKLAALQQAIFMVEMHGPAEMPMLKNAALVINWCREHNYTAWYMKDHKILHSAQEVAHRGRCHFLLLPMGMDYPEYLKDIKEGDEIGG